MVLWQKTTLVELVVGNNWNASVKAKRLSLRCALGSFVLLFCCPKMLHAVLVTITPTDPASAGLTDHIAYTFRVDPQGSLTSFSAVFTSDTMNQVNPGGLPTIWLDNGNFLEDSQFLFPSSEWPLPRFDEDEKTGPSPPGVLSATASRGGMPALTSSFDLARVVIPDDAVGQWQITVRVSVDNGMPMNVEKSGVFGAVPEASQVLVGIVMSMGLIGIKLFRRIVRSEVTT